MPVKIDSKIPEFINATEAAEELLLDKMESDIFVLSQAKVPKRDGDLAASGSKNKLKPKSRRVAYDEKYAAYQHRGRRKDGTRVVKKYTTAGTGKGFLQEAGAKVVGKSTQYAKQVMGRAKV